MPTTPSPRRRGFYPQGWVGLHRLDDGVVAGHQSLQRAGPSGRPIASVIEDIGRQPLFDVEDVQTLGDARVLRQTDRQADAAACGDNDRPLARRQIVLALADQRFARRRRDVEGKIAQYRRLIPASTQARGASHPETLRYRGSLAGGLAQTGETEAARREFEAVLAGSTVQLGADHRDTLSSKRALAFHHKYNLGDAATGVAMLREVVAACARNPELGREYQHPSSSRSFAAELADWERAL